MVISFRQRGDFKKMESFLDKASSLDIRSLVEPYAIEGVRALSAATPYHSGLAANSWGYEIETKGDQVKIIWTNSNVENGFPVVIALQYGYATGTGGYVAGRDFINPAIQPIFDKIGDAVWKVVTSA